MSFQLSSELENSLQAAVQCGQFASIDDAVNEAVRRLLDERISYSPAQQSDLELGSIGALREDAELLDQVVEHAMQVREGRPWRLTPI